MAETKVFPLSRHRNEVRTLAAELHGLDDERRMIRWRSYMEASCGRLEGLQMSVDEYRQQVSSFAVAVQEEFQRLTAVAATPTMRREDPKSVDG